MVSINLMRGAIAMMSEGIEVINPVLQVIDVSLVKAPRMTAERYRMLLSDGDYIQQAIIATQMNSLARSGRLRRGSIVQLDEFICILVHRRRVIFGINLEVLIEKCDLIGELKLYHNDQQRVLLGNPHVYDGPHVGTPVAGQKTTTGISVTPKLEPGTSNPSNGGSMPGRDVNVDSLNHLQLVSASVDLTRGAIMIISAGAEVIEPVLQVSDITLVKMAQSKTERYRVLLSDGIHLKQAILSTQTNSTVKEGRLQEGSIIKLSEFACNVTIQGCRIITVNNLEVLVEKCQLIGKRKHFDIINPVAPQNQSATPAVSRSASGNSQANVGAMPARNSTHTEAELHAGNSVDSHLSGGSRLNGNTSYCPGSQTCQQPRLMHKIKEFRKELLEKIDRMDAEYSNQISQLRRDYQAREEELTDEWTAKLRKLIDFVEQMK